MLVLHSNCGWGPRADRNGKSEKARRLDMGVDSAYTT